MQGFFVTCRRLRCTEWQLAKDLGQMGKKRELIEENDTNTSNTIV